MAHSCTLNLQYELNNPELYRRVVQEGLAFAIMPRNAFSDAEAFGVVARDIVERASSALWMVDHPLTPAGEAVRSALLDVIAMLMADGTLKARPLP